MDYKLLYKYFEGLASQQEEETIRQWVEESPENRDIFLKERRVFDTTIVNNDSIGEDSQDVNVDINTRLISKKKVYLQEIVKIAAVLLIAILGSWYYFVHIENGEDLRATQTINVPAGQRINLELPDGTDVWLNAKTTLKYPVSFNKKERIVTIDGQAFFNVAKNEEAPFIVKTTNATVKALGTQFDVMAYSDSQEFEAMLMEGSIEVRMTDDSSQPLLLKPNSKSVLRNGKLERIYVNDLSCYEWKNGLISFRKEPFADIMTTFEKTYDMKIVIEKDEISDLLYSGKFRITDGIEYALRVLQKDIGFEYERDTEHHIIYIR
jgi:ferric-dicitrate binding protein FerR (iron transport regulator)